MDYTGTFQNGMIRPDGPVNLPEGARVEFHAVGAVGMKGAATPIEELRALSDRFFGGVRAGRGENGAAGADVWPETEGVDEFLAFVREARR
jgi:hypothetical protein